MIWLWYQQIYMVHLRTYDYSVYYVVRIPSTTTLVLSDSYGGAPIQGTVYSSGTCSKLIKINSKSDLNEYILNYNCG